MTVVNCLTLKTPVWCTIVDDYISYVIRVIVIPVLKFPNFRYHGNKGSSELNVNNTVRLPDLDARPRKPPVSCKNPDSISYVSRLNSYFSDKSRYHGNRGQSEVNFNATVRFSDHDFLKRVGYFGDQKSSCVILDEFITWALVIPEVARAPNQQSISGLDEKVYC